MSLFFNEFDPFAAAWLRQLMADGHLPHGVVDARSIADVASSEVVGYRRQHYFAGIAGWELALQLAGFPQDRSVWTGSCPCQPYSSAGKRKGNADERDLWPAFARLIRECRPPAVFGEQVASSLTVGRRGKKTADVRELQDREAVFGVLRELQRAAAAGVQDVLPSEGTSEEAAQLIAHLGAAEEVATRLPRGGTGERCQVAGKNEGHGVRHRSGRHPEADRRGPVRTDWNSLLAIGAEKLERAFAGSHRPGRGIHEGERPGGSLCPERDGEHVGAGEDFGDCVGDLSEAARSVRLALVADWGEVDESLRVWIDRVRADLEAEGYAVGFTVLGAHSAQAPHQRQRLYWVAHTGQVAGRPAGEQRPDRDRAAERGEEATDAERRGATRGAGDADDEREGTTERHGAGAGNARGTSGGAVWDHWRDAITIDCRDGKRRRVPAEPALFPLAHGIPNRVGLLRGAGNAICVQTAALFIRAFLEAEGGVNQ